MSTVGLIRTPEWPTSIGILQAVFLETLWSGNPLCFGGFIAQDARVILETTWSKAPLGFWESMMKDAPVFFGVLLSKTPLRDSMRREGGTCAQDVWGRKLLMATCVCEDHVNVFCCSSPGAGR